MGEKMKNIKNLDHQSENKDILNNKKKNFSLLNCKKDEFKDWFDPL